MLNLNFEIWFLIEGIENMFSKGENVGQEHLFLPFFPPNSVLQSLPFNPFPNGKF